MKLKVHFRHCYGIKELKHEFDFGTKNVFAIYASNGTMKTSFAKTFVDFSKNKYSKDEIYEERETIRDIKDENEDLSQDVVFVIQPYDEEYQSDDIASLLINKDLKKQYDAGYAEIEKAKNDFLKGIEQLSGLKSNDIESEISKVFHREKTNKFFESLQKIKNKIKDADTDFSEICYAAIFNNKTEEILTNRDIIQNIETYVAKYNQLLENSRFFKKGVFNHTQAKNIATQLENNGFFEAKHGVVLRNNKKPITDKESLEKVINKEKKAILENEELKTLFEELDKILEKNKDLREFRKYLSENPTILAELKNTKSFKCKLWLSYCQQYKDDFDNLLKKYEEVKTTIELIKEKAKTEKGDWDRVIEIFNDRFFVPFTLEVENKTNVMLGNDEAPSIAFIFNDEKEGKKVEKETLLKVLSQGEKRALYILNILFELEVRKNQNKKCLLIIDDIADSFDYKNKYAIIEYLNEISNNSQFYLIVLSHNFDFYRSICSRLDMERKNKLHVIKKENEITLEEEHYQNNPLNCWRKKLNKKKFLLASIPMVRNLCEYSGKTDAYKQLTAFLHMKENTTELTICNLKKQYETILEKKYTEKIKYLDKNFYELLINTSDEIVQSDAWKLEDKIILSIAIRLKAEEFMFSKVGKDEYSHNQTFDLFKKFKEKFPDEKDNVKILEKVVLMTPENIHLNSFMYEPIIDMGIDELKKLYKDIKNIQAK